MIKKADSNLKIVDNCRKKIDEIELLKKSSINLASKKNIDELKKKKLHQLTKTLISALGWTNHRNREEKKKNSVTLLRKPIKNDDNEKKEIVEVKKELFVKVEEKEKEQEKEKEKEKEKNSNKVIQSQQYYCEFCNSEIRMTEILNNITHEHKKQQKNLYRSIIQKSQAIKADIEKETGRKVEESELEEIIESIVKVQKWLESNLNNKITNQSHPTTSLTSKT